MKTARQKRLRRLRYPRSANTPRRNRFARSYGETHTFNVKLPGDVEKAFWEMQKDEGWLRMR